MRLGRLWFEHVVAWAGVCFSALDFSDASGASCGLMGLHRDKP